MPAVRPDVRALLRSQAGLHAGAWLAAIPTDPATTLPPDLMHFALRRRMRLPLPLTRARCGRAGAPGCRAVVDNPGDHALACPGTGLLARRGFVLERAWIQVVRKAIGPEGRVVPQQWLANTTAPGVAADDRRRLDFVIYGAAARRGPLLRCHLGSANQTRWQPSSWSAGARRGRTCHGSSPQACPLPGVRPWRPAPLVCTCCRDRRTLERRFTAFCATSRCIASTPRSRHVAWSRSAGLGKALVGVFGGCCPERGLQCCLRRMAMPSLPNAEGDLPIAEVLHLAADQAPSRLPLR